MKKKIQTGFWLDEELHESFKTYSAYTGRRMTDLFEQAAQEFFDRMNASKSKKISKLIASSRTRFTEADRGWMTRKIPEDVIDQFWGDVLAEAEDIVKPAPRANKRDDDPPETRRTLTWSDFKNKKSK
jgi:hypothetical protein